MKLSVSNILSIVVPTVVSGAGGGLLSEVTSSDHSGVYTGSDSEDLILSFGAASIGYVAVSGHNVAPGIITILDGVTEVESITLTRNHVVMFTFTPNRVFADLRVKFDTAQLRAVTVPYISAGDYMELPSGGEQSGFSRNWLARPIKQRAITNSMSAPVSSLNTRVPLSGVLAIPDSPTLFSRDAWQIFYDYLEFNPFFIREVDDLPESTTLCFNPKFTAPKAHSETRDLDKLSISFKAFNGL